MLFKGKYMGFTSYDLYRLYLLVRLDMYNVHTISAVTKPHR